MSALPWEQQRGKGEGTARLLLRKTGEGVGEGDEIGNMVGIDSIFDV